MSLGQREPITRTCTHAQYVLEAVGNTSGGLRTETKANNANDSNTQQADSNATGACTNTETTSPQKHPLSVYQQSFIDTRHALIVVGQRQVGLIICNVSDIRIIRSVIVIRMRRAGTEGRCSATG